MLICALNEHGEMVSIDQVPRGNDCNCVCPGCGTPLQAVKGQIKKHYFRHRNETDRCNNLTAARESQIHYLAKLAISYVDKIRLPAVVKTFLVYRGVAIEPLELIPAKEWNILRSECEDTSYEGFQPDVTVETESAIIAIEVYYTHEVDDDKLTKIKESHLNCLEVSFKKSRIEDIDHDYILNQVSNPEHSKWLHFEYSDEQKQQIEHYLNGHRTAIDQRLKRQAIWKKKQQEEYERQKALQEARERRERLKYARSACHSKLEAMVSTHFAGIIKKTSWSPIPKQVKKAIDDHLKFVDSIAQPHIDVEIRKSSISILRSAQANASASYASNLTKEFCNDNRRLINALADLDWHESDNDQDDVALDELLCDLLQECFLFFNKKNNGYYDQYLEEGDFYY